MRARGGFGRLSRVCGALLALSALLARAEAPGTAASPRVVSAAAAAPSGTDGDGAGGDGGRRVLLQSSGVADYTVSVAEQSNVTLNLEAPSPLRAVLLPGAPGWLAGVALLAPVAARPPQLLNQLAANWAVAGAAVPATTAARVTNATARLVTLAVPALTLGAETASGSLVYMLYDGAALTAPVNVTLRVTPLLLPALSRFRRWPLWALWPEGSPAAVDWWAPGGAAAAAQPPALPAGHYLVQRVLAPEAGAPATAARLSPFPLAWGRNDAALLGGGDAAPRRVPALQTALSGTGATAPRFAAVSAAGGHAVGVTSDGRVFAWGQGADAALGQGPGLPAAPTATPLAVTGGGLSGSVVVAVAAGGAHSLALTTAGAVFSWGDNSRGQLGRAAADAAAVAAGSPAPAASLPARVAFPAGVTITALAAGRAHSLALAADGAIWAWGDNGAAQLGLAACEGAADASAPGAVACQRWGGADPRPVVPTPARQAGFAARADDAAVDSMARPPLRFVAARSVAAAGDSSFALAFSPPGALFAWGSHAAGMLGLGSAGAVLSPEADVAALPVPVPGLRGVELVSLAASATSRHALALGADGAVYAWGDNTRGQLGVNASAAVAWDPVRVTALAGINISALAAGGAHSLAVSDVGEVFAWGSDAFGQCGVGPPPTPQHLLTRRGWLAPPDFADGVTAAASGAPPMLDATPMVLPSPGDPGAADDDGLSPVQWAAAAATARRRRSLLQAGAVAYPTVRPALSGSAFAAAASGLLSSAAAAATGGWGAAPGHGAASAGEWLAVVPYPALVAGAQQADWVAAGAATSFAVRRGCAPGTELQRGVAGIGAGVCVPCARGSISTALSSLTCTACPTGQASPDPGGTVCALCAAGSYAAATGTANCTLCDAGKYLPFPGAAAAAQCLVCPRGSFGAQKGAAACVRCPPGAYASEESAQACSTCVAGTYQPRVGASNVTQCIKCPSGTFSGASGAAQCSPCAPGSYSGAPGAQACTPCRAGTYSDSTGALACTACPPGLALGGTGGSTLGNCSACLAGSYAPSPGAAECTPCPYGAYSDTPAATRCKSCAAGTYGNASGASAAAACLPCPPGRHATSPGSAWRGATAIDKAPCQACPAGTYAQRPGAVDCTPCAAGTFGPQEGADAILDCSPCTVGHFCPFAGMGEALACPAGTYQASEGAVVCTACPIGKFVNLMGSESLGACSPCPAGTYTDVLGTANCMACQPGTYGPTPGLSRCTPCSPGRASPNPGEIESYVCAACPVGFFAGAEGMTECEQCPAGTYGPETGSAACTPCPLGTYSGEKGASVLSTCLACPVGSTTAAEGATACLPCPAGTVGAVAADGSNVCVPCPAGTFQNASGVVGTTAACLPCGPGLYAPLPGAAACAPCPPGSYREDGAVATLCSLVPRGSFLDASGSRSAAAAQKCPIGTFAPDLGSARCTACPPGSYMNVTGASVCFACPAGTATGSAGSTTADVCAPCERGFFAAAGSASCSQCVGGTYAPGAGAGECLLCPPGTAQFLLASYALSDCAPCAAGTYAASAGSKSCQPCPPGQYSSATASTACSPCPKGTALNATRATSVAGCIACQRSKYAPQLGSAVCDPCPPGNYCPYTGMGDALPCPKGTYGPSVGAGALTACEWCPRFFFNSTPGSASITDCKFMKQSAAPRRAAMLLLVLALAALAAC